MLTKHRYLSDIVICIHEPPNRRVVVPAAQVIQLRFLIVDIATIAERVALAQRRGRRTGGGDRLAPCVALVFYNECARIVKQPNDVTPPKQSLMFFPIFTGRAADVGLEHP